MPGFSINNFRSDLDRRGVQRTNRATILFAPPPKLSGTDTTAIAIRCDSVQLPAVWFTIGEHKRYGVGPTDKVPIQPMFDPLPASFIADMNGQTHKFFYDWTMLIGNYNSQGGGYEGEYQSNFVTDIFVLTFNEQQEQLMQYQFINAFPQGLQETQMNWADHDQLVKLNVAFNFREWRQTTVNDSLVDTVNNVITSAERVVGSSSLIPTGVLDSILSIF